MIIESVKLVNFRSHEAYNLDCRKNTTLIVGENGCGKTSILEAMYLALRGKSFRATDKDILKRDMDYYRVEVNYRGGEKIIVLYDGSKKTFLVDEKKTSRLPRQAKYPVIIFLPEDLHLVKTSPTKRRDYFDNVISGIDEIYNNNLLKYNKILKQRNELLKSEALTKNNLFSWDILLSKYGFILWKARREFVSHMNMKITDTYRSIAKNLDEVEIEYRSQEIKDENDYLSKINASYERDRTLGYTSFGVHRDDFVFKFNKTDADRSASRGETRSIILAMKFIEAELIYDKTMKKPLVLLDDVFSELDDARQKCLVKNFKNNQVIITSVDGI